MRRLALSPRGAGGGGGEPGLGWGSAARAPGPGAPTHPARPLPDHSAEGKPRRSPAARSPPGRSPAARGEETAPHTAGHVDRLRDPRPATPGQLTHRPSSCSASFTLKRRPEHPPLPAPSLTHFPAEPAPSITPAPPPPPPPQAWPRSVAEGACGSCRRDRRKTARGGGQHSWRRARRIVGIVVQLRSESLQKRGLD